MNMAETPSGTISALLDAREQRAARQESLIAQYQSVLITFTMNIPGPIKNASWISASFEYGKKDLLNYFSGVPLILVQEKVTAAGPEAFFIIRDTLSALEIKRLTIRFEDHHPAGRWFDIDVRDRQGAYISRSDAGKKPRTCFLCGKAAKICARSRAHSVETLFAYTKEQLEQFLAQKKI
jgi:holo-ACP synthase CitX